MKTMQPKSAQSPARARKIKEDMSVILRDIPAGYNWGWFSREDQRMHLQTVDDKHRSLHYKVWLENKGRRVIEAEAGIPPKVLRALEAAIQKQRESVEAQWASFMIRNGWLKVQLVGDTIVLTAYPKSQNRFERTMDLLEIIPNEEIAKKVTAKDVALSKEFAFLEIFPQRPEAYRQHEPLDRILWVE